MEGLFICKQIIKMRAQPDFNGTAVKRWLVAMVTGIKLAV